MLLGVATVGLLVALALRVYEPVVTRYWLNQLEVKRRTPVQPLSRLGPKAVRILLRDLRDEDSIARRSYRSAWTNVPTLIQGWLPPPTPVDPHLISETMKALSGLGPAALPQLLSARNDPNIHIRHTVLGAIGRMGPAATGALPGILELLRDPNAEIRDEVLGVLEQLGVRNKDVVAALTRLLHDNDLGTQPGTTVYVREHAAQILGEMGSDANAAVPDLHKMLNDPHSYAQEQAALALWRITGETNVVSTLAAAFEQAADAQTRQRILTIFEEMGPGAKDAVPLILTGLKDNSTAVQEQAVQLLGQMRSDARAIVPKLLQMLEDSDPYTRGQAAYLLWRITGETNVISQLAGALEHAPDIHASRRILTAIGEMGPAAKAAIPAMVAILKISNTNQLDGCELRYNPDGDLVVIDVKDNAAEVLGGLGSDARTAVPELQRLLSDRRPWRREQAALALWRIDHDTTIVSILTTELRQAAQAKGPEQQFDAPGICGRIIAGLGEMGVAAKPAVPIMIELIRTSKSLQAVGTATSKLRKIAGTSITKIDPDIAVILTPLEK
jgi:HEAT repeat protein